MVEVSVYQENITIVNIDASIDRGPKYMIKNNKTEWRNRQTIIFGDISTLLSIIAKNKQKIRKDIKGLNDVMK